MKPRTPKSVNKASFSDMLEEHNISKQLLENSKKDSEKYTQSILNKCGSRVKEWTKIKWWTYHSDGLVTFERNFDIRIRALNTSSYELQMYVGFIRKEMILIES
jgi:hypothetical protein